MGSYSFFLFIEFLDGFLSFFSLLRKDSLLGKIFSGKRIWEEKNLIRKEFGGKIPFSLLIFGGMKIRFSLEYSLIFSKNGGDLIWFSFSFLFLFSFFLFLSFSLLLDNIILLYIILFNNAYAHTRLRAHICVRTRTHTRIYVCTRAYTHTRTCALKRYERNSTMRV